MNRQDAQAQALVLGTAWCKESSTLPPAPITPDDVITDADVGQLFENLYDNGNALKRLGEIHEADLRLLDEIAVSRGEWQ